MVAGMHEQTHTPNLQDQELAGLQSSAQAPGLADDPLTDRAFQRNLPRGWLDPEMSWDAVPTGRRGRQRTYSDSANQTAFQ